MRSKRDRGRLAPFAVLALAGLAVLLTSCTNPVYKREVVYKYDADGKLVGTEVRIGVQQMDPNAYPLRGDLGELQQPILDPTLKRYTDRRDRVQ